MNIFTSLNIIDHQVSQSVLLIRSDFLTRFFLCLTKLGDWKVILILTVLLLAVFWFYSKRNLILPFLITVAGSGLMTTALKYIVLRPRPADGLPLVWETGPSFPSAHATLALALFGFLIYLIWRYYSNWNLAVKIVLTFVLAPIILLVGFSRFYLGVHFATDVIAGYLVGLLWLLIGMHISREKKTIY